MIETLNPTSVPQPVTSYSQAIVHAAGLRRVVISGQIGVRADGSVVDGLEAQVKQAFENLIHVVEAAGLKRENVVKTVAYMVAGGDVQLFRRLRAESFGDHRPASTYVVVAGLADPRFLFEIEGEAVG